MIISIYDRNNNGGVKVNIKRKKRVCEMSSQEILMSGFGMFR